MLKLNDVAGQCQSYAPPVGEVTTLAATSLAAPWPVGTRIILGDDPRDTSPTVLGVATLSGDAMTATWPLDEPSCALLRAARRLTVQIPSGASWEPVLSGAVIETTLWTSGKRTTQTLGSVVIGPQGPPGALIIDASDAEGVTLTLAEGSNITAASDAEGVTLTTV